MAVQAVLNPNGTTGMATSVSFTGDVVGPISQLDLTQRSLTVLGQTIQLDAATLFGEGIQPGSIGSLQKGMIVEVSGFADASGNLLASRIDMVTGAPLQVRGIVQTLDAGAQTFRINELTIDYSGVAPGGKLVNGSTATVQAVESPTDGILHATRVQASSGIGGTVNEQGQLEGLITSFQSAEAFYVGDQLVLASSSTHECRICQDQLIADVEGISGLEARNEPLELPLLIHCSSNSRGRLNLRGMQNPIGGEFDCLHCRGASIYQLSARRDAAIVNREFVDPKVCALASSVCTVPLTWSGAPVTMSIRDASRFPDASAKPLTSTLMPF